MDVLPTLRFYYNLVIRSETYVQETIGIFHAAGKPDPKSLGGPSWELARGSVFICHWLVFGILFSTVLTAPVLGQPTDIKGYGNTEWGMSPSEVLNADPEAVEVEDPPSYVDYIAPVSKDFEDMIFEMEVDYQFVPEEDSLAQVVIDPNETNTTAFEQMARQLVRRYGRPTYRRNADNNEAEILWRFPTTTIELSYEGESAGSTLQVTYFPTIGEATAHY